MSTRKNLGLWKSALVVALAAVTLAFVGRTPALEAQGRPDLEAQHQRLLPLFEMAGVVFTDADERRGRLVVGIVDRRGEGQVRGRLRALGIDSQSVDVIETDEIFALATLRDRSDAIVGGLQIRFSQFLCSLGFPAFNANGIPGFVTASHCSDNQGAVDDTLYYQPSAQIDEDLIGTEIADPPYVRNGPGCPRGRKCRRSDANFSRSDGPRSITIGTIARTTGLGSLELASTPFTITGEGVAQPPATVNKVGRTTGWTQGTVSNTCVNTGVSGSSIVLLCQTFVTGDGVIVQGGDSGSPVFAIAGGTNVTLLGGLWGGNSDGSLFVYSPIANIRGELGNLRTR
jgi:hypothetical protein